MNLPSVRFTPRQVFSPAVQYETGVFEFARLFSQNDETYCDECYLNGELVHCFDGFGKLLLHKIWSIFHDPLIAKLYLNDPQTAPNPQAVELYNNKDLGQYFGAIKLSAASNEAHKMLGNNSPDSLL